MEHNFLLILVAAQSMLMKQRQILPDITHGVNYFNISQTRYILFSLSYYEGGLKIFGIVIKMYLKYSYKLKL